MPELDKRINREFGYSLDYFALTIFPEVVDRHPVANTFDIIKACSEALGLPEGFESTGARGRGFTDIRTHEDCPGFIFYCVPAAKGQFYTSLEIKGEGCRAFSPEQLQVLGDRLSDLGCTARTSRIDFAFDHDYFVPADLMRCWPHARTRLKRWDWRESPEGTTFYCGSRESFQLCCYDSRGFTRSEIRIYGKYSHLYGQLLLSGKFDAAALAGLGVFSSAITFCEADGSQMAGWDSLVSHGTDPYALDSRPSRVPVPSYFSTLLAIKKQKLDRLLAEARIIGAGLGYPLSLLTEMLERMNPDAASAPAVEKIKKLTR